MYSFGGTTEAQGHVNLSCEAPSKVVKGHQVDPWASSEYAHLGYGLSQNGYGNSRIIIMIELRTVVVVGFQTLGLEVVRILSTFNPENGTLKPSTPGTSCWIAGCWVN